MPNSISQSHNDQTDKFDASKVDSDLVAPGWSGENPLNFLASIGLLHLARDQGKKLKLGWQEGLWNPVFVGAKDITELAKLIVEATQFWANHEVFNLFSENPEEDIRVHHDFAKKLLAKFWRDSPESQILNAFFTTTQLRDKDVVQATWFHFLAGRMKFLKIAKNLPSLISHSKVLESLQIGLFEDESNCDFLWNSASGRTHAYRAKKPSDSPNRNDPVANWLALHGLRSMPCIPRVDNQNIAGFRIRKKALFWPIWLSPLSLEALTDLIAFIDPEKPQLVSAWGMKGILWSRVIKAGKNQGFSPATWYSVDNRCVRQ